MRFQGSETVSKANYDGSQNFSAFWLPEEEAKMVTLENILTERVDKEIKNANCSVDVLVDGEKRYRNRVLYKLSVTSDGKLYAQVKLQ